MTNECICPFCSSAETTFKKKVNLWECNDCESRFEFSSSRGLEPQTIFLSYAHKSEREADYDLTEELVWIIKDELEKDGHKVWIDREGIAAGYQWRERITNAILDHRHFLSFLSKRSVRDPGVCLNEIAIALGSGRHIQTLLTEREELVRQPLTISHLQWHHFVGWKEIKEGKKSGAKGEMWDTWFSDRMLLIRNNLSDLQRIKIAGELQRLKDILDPRTFEADIVNSINGFYGRQWLFDACKAWLNNSSDRLFWLKGSPGIGKSCFAAKLVHQSNSNVVGFFKCDFQRNKSPEESASECIRTLAYQLATRLPDYRMKLLYQQQLDADKVQKKTADDLFNYLISEPLNTSGKIPESTRLVLVIDALDEAGRNDGTNALADLVYKNADKLPPWLGIIITSRPEPYLEQMLNKFDTTSVEGHTEENLQDLRDYLNEMLDESLVGQERNAIINQIIEKSGGTFLYLKLIEKDMSLALTKPELLPCGIDDIFMRDFKRYYPSSIDYERMAEPFIRLMAAAPGQLPINLGRDLLGWKSRDITIQIIQPLGSLLKEKNACLTFFHKSLSDWLQDPKRSGAYHVNETGSQELGNFLWQEFEKFDASYWQTQVIEWLATLLPHTKYWENLKCLDRFADFLEDHSRFRSAIIIRQQYLKRSISLFPKNSPQVAGAYFKCGVLYGNVFELDLSNEHLIISKEIQENLTPFDEELFSETLDALGIIAGWIEAKLDISIEYFERSINIKEKSANLHPSSLAKTLNYLAIVKDAKSDFNAANNLYERAISLFKYYGVSNASDFANLLNNYSIVVLRANGGLVFGKENPFNQVNIKFEYAKDIMEGAYNIFDILKITVSNRNLATILNNLGIAHHNLNQKEKAGEIFSKAYNTCLDSLGERHPDLATVLNNQGALLSSYCQDDDAYSCYLDSLKMFEESLLATHPHVARCLNNLGILEHERGNLIDAYKLYERAYSIYSSTIGDSHCDTAQIQNNIALLDIQLGEITKGSVLLKKVLDTRIKTLGIKHPQVANSYIHLSRAHFWQHKYSESYEYLMKGINLLNYWHVGNDYLVSLKNEAYMICHKGNIAKNTWNPAESETLRAREQNLEENGVRRFLENYIQSLAITQSKSFIIENSKNKSGSFLRMQLEVLDICFSNKINNRIQ